MADWLDLTRRHDAAGAIMRGRRPSRNAYGGLGFNANNVVAHPRFDVDALLDDDDRALDHILAKRADELAEAADDAARWAEAEELVGPARPAPPWEMTADAYEAEVTDLLDRHTRAGTLDEVDRARLFQLIPERFEPYLDTDSWADLHRRIVLDAIGDEF
jgi:hypothetical protein